MLNYQRVNHIGEIPLFLLRTNSIPAPRQQLAPRQPAVRPVEGIFHGDLTNKHGD